MTQLTHSAALQRLTGDQKFTRRVQRKIVTTLRGLAPVFLPRAWMRRGSGQRVQRVALIIKGQHWHTATGHIRLLSPLRQVSEQAAVDVRPVAVDWLLGGGIGQVDAVIVQRDALAPNKTDALIAAVRAGGVPLLFEIDDWLWNIPHDHADHGITDAHIESMLKLVRAATGATVSTDHLAGLLRTEGCPVTVIPNGLDEKLWERPLPADFVAAVGAENGLKTGKPTLLYMGTTSHAEDLKLIETAIGRLRDEFPDLDIVQIGGGRLLPGGREIKVPYEATEYPEFVLWFRAVCSYATLAVAPLRDNEFNAAKSDIKTLDYGLGLVPAVYSNVGPYRATVIDGVTGLLCENDADAWYDTVKRLLNAPELRAAIVTQARAAAQKRGLSRQGVHQWRAVLAQLDAPAADAERAARRAA